MLLFMCISPDFLFTFPFLSQTLSFVFSLHITEFLCLFVPLESTTPNVFFFFLCKEMPLTQIQSDSLHLAHLFPSPTRRMLKGGVSQR